MPDARTNPYAEETGRDFDAANMERIDVPGLPWVSVAAYDTNAPVFDHYTLLLECEPPWPMDDPDAASSEPSWLWMTASRDAICSVDDYVEVTDQHQRIPWEWLPERVRSQVIAKLVEGWVTPGSVLVHYDERCEEWVVQSWLRS